MSRLFYHARPVLVALVALLAPMACSDLKEDLLEPQQPGVITPEAAASPTGADALRKGALGRLRSATEGGDGLWLYSGLLADEWKTGDTFVQRVETDQRQFQTNNAQIIALERNAHRLRGAARDAIEALRVYWPADSLAKTYEAQMWWVMGTAELTLAENWCNGMPYSFLVDGVPTYGAPKTSLDGLRFAGTHLDSALTLATPPDTATVTLLRAIQLTRARIMVDTGNFAGAAALVAGIPTNYKYLQTHSLTTSDVGSWSFTNSQKRWVVGDSFDTSGLIQNALPFASANDPRVPVGGNSAGTGGACAGANAISTTTFMGGAPTCSAGRAFDNATWFVQQNIWSRSDAVPLLSGVDARLIEAEAQIQLNTPAGDAAALAILNTLRGTAQYLGSAYNSPVMAALPAPANHTLMTNLFFREKAFWQFGRGYRLGDLRRLMRQYGRAQGAVFPTGTFFKNSQPYGTDITFPVTTDEGPNPQYVGCIDKNP
jgi:hypothetical protein